MKAFVLGGLLALSFSATAANSPSSGQRFASKLGCGDSSTGLQRVYAYFNGANLDDWTAAPAEIHREKLPDGSTIGVKIGPVPSAFYGRTPFRNMHYAPDMVEISLFDMKGNAPRLIGHGFGGASSIQSYFGKVDKDKPFDLNNAGLTLVLAKTSCVSLTASR